MTLRAGASAALELPFSACPQPDVSWTFKGGRLPDSRRFKTDNIYNMTSMTMAKILKTDAGEYNLTLSNPHGKVTWSVKLIVLGELARL